VDYYYSQFCKCPLRLGSEILPKRSWAMWRSSTKGTGSSCSQGVHLVTKQLDVPTIMSPAFRHLLCFHFVCCSKKIRGQRIDQPVNRPVVSLLGTRVGGTSTEMITKTPRVPNCNFLQPQAVRGVSTITRIWSPMVVTKNVCQRLADHASSLR